MDNVRILRYDWYTGMPGYGSVGEYLARQYDHLSDMVVLSHAPKLNNYYLIVAMKETEGGEVKTLEPIQLSGSFWLIPNIYTQLAQEISFQFCCKTESGDFESHSAQIHGRILPSKDHNGAAIDVDPSVMFDPYKQWVSEIAMAAGAIVIDSELSSSSTNPVQNRIVKAAIDGLVDDVDAVNGRLHNLDEALNEVVTPVLTWERGNIKADGTNANNGRKVRTASPVVVDGDVLHLEFDGSYSNDSILFVFIYNGETFVERVNKTASADIPITSGYGVRFLLSIGENDTETIIPVESADDYLTVTYDHIMNVHTDKTLTVSDRPADAKIVGQRITDIVNVQSDIPLVWERGAFSSTGSNTRTDSLVVIRTKKPAIPAEYPTIYYSVDSGYKMTVWKNDDGTQSFTSNLTGDGSFSFGGEGVFRLTLCHTDDSNIDPSEGSHVRIYGIEDLKTTVNDLTERADKSDYESFMSFSIFQKFGVIGDSFASGSLHHPDDGGWTGNYEMSWPQILARQTGSQAVNFTKGGLSTKTWLENTTWGLAKLLATEAQQLYIIALGINDSTQIDAGTLSLGTIADVDTEDYTQNPNTFYGNYGRIIGNIMTHAPYAKIACLSVARLNERSMDTHIKAIADKYGLPFVDLTSDPYFTSTVYYGSIISNHPLTYGYAGMAKAIERLICLDVIENPYWDTYYGLTAEDESGEPDE